MTTSASAVRFRLLHVGVAVPSLGPAAEMLRDLFGYQTVSGPFEDAVQRVAVSFLKQGEEDASEIELIAPLTADSPIASTLSKRNGGAYHLCFETNDLDAALEMAKGKGCVLLGEPASAVAFGGRRIAWIYAPTRQLFELVEGVAATEEMGASGG